MIESFVNFIFGYPVGETVHSKQKSYEYPIAVFYIIDIPYGELPRIKFGEPANAMAHPSSFKIHAVTGHSVSNEC